MKSEKEKGSWKSIRGAFHTVHLWLGVGSALILFVVCLSGTIYTFSSEIQKLTDSDLYQVSVEKGQKPLPVNSLIAHVLDTIKGGVVQAVVIPEDQSGSYQIVVGKKERQKKEESNKAEQKKIEHSKNKSDDAKKSKGGPPRARGKTYFVNPYTNEILGTGTTSSSEFFMFMFRLHRWLLLDTEVGRPIVGAATLIFVVIIISGLVIWFPKKIKNWRQGLTIKTSANWKRVNHDLHNSLGLYASLFLLVMALTGLTWSFEWYKTGFNDVLGIKGKNGQVQFSSAFVEGQNRSIEDYVTSANEMLHYPGESRVMIPSDSSGVVTIMKTKNTFFATSVADRVILDQYSAAVLNVELFADKPLNEKIAASVKALHIGSFYGTFSKIIYFISCLIGTSLPVTGVIIWINKLRKKNQKKEPGVIVRKDEKVLESSRRR